MTEFNISKFYHMGWIDIEIRKFVFVANTQFFFHFLVKYKKIKEIER